MEKAAPKEPPIDTQYIKLYQVYLDYFFTIRNILRSPVLYFDTT